MSKYTGEYTWNTWTRSDKPHIRTYVRRSLDLLWECSGRYLSSSNPLTPLNMRHFKKKRSFQAFTPLWCIPTKQLYNCMYDSYCWYNTQVDLSPAEDTSPYASPYTSAGPYASPYAYVYIRTRTHTYTHTNTHTHAHTHLHTHTHTHTHTTQTHKHTLLYVCM